MLEDIKLDKETELPVLKPILNPDFESEVKKDDDLDLVRAVVSPPLRKQKVDTDELIKYLEANVYSILTLPYSKDSMKASLDDAMDYLELYDNEVNAIKPILVQFEPTLKICNNLYTDRLFWLSVKSIKHFLKFKYDHINPDRPETSPRHRIIRENVHKNIKINAERMKRNFCKKKRVFVKTFQIGDNISVKVPKEDRNKIGVRRIPAVVVKIKHSCPPMYKLACKFGTIEGYFSTSHLMPYPGVVEICNENSVITSREAARENSVLKKDVVICKCKKNCNTNRCPCNFVIPDVMEVEAVKTRMKLIVKLCCVFQSYLAMVE